MKKFCTFQLSATISSTDIQKIEEMFYWILDEINHAWYLSPEAVFVDATHIKANTNLNKAVKISAPQAAKIYENQLMKEINKDRDKHGEKPFDSSKPYAPNSQLTLKVVYFIKVSMRNVLHIRHKQAQKLICNGCYSKSW